MHAYEVQGGKEDKRHSTSVKEHIISMSDRTVLTVESSYRVVFSWDVKPNHHNQQLFT